MKLLLLLLLVASATFAQQKYSSKSKKAISLFEEGMDAPRLNKDQYGRENYVLGLEILDKAIEKDPAFWEAYLLAGEYAEYTNQSKRAVEYYEKAIQIALEMKKQYVWLGVWEENKRALQFYRKNGFVEFDKHIFKLGEEEQTDFMMKLELTH
jgi:ribosomal protein S18 acetylase RimI-like enzyme